MIFEDKQLWHICCLYIYVLYLYLDGLYLMVPGQVYLHLLVLFVNHLGIHHVPER